jgi:hypothetical protein
MREPQDLALQAKGWEARPIARGLGVSRNTVKRYLTEGGWVAYRRPAPRSDGRSSSTRKRPPALPTTPTRRNYR